jgi:hypothetical protein
MEGPLAGIAEHYKRKYGADDLSNSSLNKLYEHYVREHQQSLLDAAAAVVAVNGLFLADQLDIDAVSPSMQEAFDLAFPNMTLDQLEDYDPTALAGIISSWKGKYFEVELRDRLNNGDWVGDIRLGAGQQAELASDLSQPGWDLAILNADGTVDTILQAKATDSLSYVRDALERYPDIEIVATDEVADNLIDEVINSEISNEEIEGDIIAPMGDLLDGPLEDVLELISPLLPVLIIGVSEGRKVMLGRQTLQTALNNSLERAVKSGVAIGVGGILALLDAGIISLPTTFLTHMSIDRLQAQRRLRKRVSSNTALLRDLGTA